MYSVNKHVEPFTITLDLPSLPPSGSMMVALRRWMDVCDTIAIHHPSRDHGLQFPIRSGSGGLAEASVWIDAYAASCSHGPIQYHFLESKCL